MTKIERIEYEAIQLPLTGDWAVTTKEGYQVVLRVSSFYRNPEGIVNAVVKLLNDNNTKVILPLQI